MSLFYVALVMINYLYEKYKEDTNLSFFFSPNPEDSKSDGEIISIVAGRSSNN